MNDYKTTRKTIKNTIHNFYCILEQKRYSIDATIIYVDFINAFKQLPLRQKQVIYYRYFLCMPVKEVANKLNISTANVSKISNLAIENTANILLGDDKNWI